MRFSLAGTNRISKLISFPTGTKTLQFPVFVIITDYLIEVGSPIQQSWVQRMHAPRPSLMQLATVFVTILA